MLDWEWAGYFHGCKLGFAEKKPQNCSSMFLHMHKFD
jgi:hypothetical protein